MAHPERNIKAEKNMELAIKRIKTAQLTYTYELEAAGDLLLKAAGDLLAAVIGLTFPSR